MAPAPRRSARGSAAQPKGKTYSANAKGAAGLRKMEEQMERQEAEAEARRNSVREPFRFYVPIGETREAIIVDEEPSFFRMEHNLLDTRTKRWSRHLPCIDEHTNCPVCGISDKPSYFAMYLTIIDLTPYEKNDGEVIDWSKKLLVVKLGQQKKFARWFEKYGSLRGMVISFSRDQQKESSIGGTIEFDDEVLTEDQLAEYYTEYQDKDKNTVAIDGAEVFDYEAIYPDMTEKQLAAMVGVKAGSSRESDDEAIGRTRRTNVRGRSRDVEEEEEETPKRSPRGSSRPAAPPSRKPARRAQEEEPEEEIEEEEEEAPRKSSRGSVSIRKPARRAQVEEEEAEEEEEERTPRRPARKASRQIEEEEEIEEEEAPPARRSSRNRNAASDVEDTLPDEEESGSRTGRRAALRRGR